MSTALDEPILIVGQGIAGTVLALHLEQRGIPFHILDDGHKTSSSLAAAGLYNPFILKRRRLAWQAATFLEDALPFYRAQDKAHGTDCLKEMDIWRRIHDVEEYNAWTSMSAESGVGAFLGEILQPKVKGLDMALGVQEVKQTGWMDVPSFLAVHRARWMATGQLSEDRFQEDELEAGPALNYAGETYGHVVICTGRMAEESKFFPQLPFTPAKGHTLIIHAPDLELAHILHGSCFLIPMGAQQFIVASTYSWSNLNEEVESEEVAKLESMLGRFCRAEYEVLQAKAGVRPATKDRRPLLGKSHVDQRIVLFGGLGSRGILTAPRLASGLIGHLMGHADLAEEVDCHRFQS